MKQKIHPKYHEIEVHCACGNSFNTRSTASELKVDEHRHHFHRAVSPPGVVGEHHLGESVLHVDVVPHDRNWGNLFREERDHLRSCLPQELIRRIEHFGSTAIPGLAASLLHVLDDLGHLLLDASVAQHEDRIRLLVQ